MAPPLAMRRLCDGKAPARDSAGHFAAGRVAGAALADFATPCTDEAREQGCTCRMSMVHATDIDPPHEVVDEWCPVHGRDPDAEADRRAEDREAEREMDDDDYGDDL